MKKARIISLLIILQFILAVNVPINVCFAKGSEDEGYLETNANWLEYAPVDTKASFDVEAKSALLIEFSTGRVLYEKGPNERLAPASVTKIMTLLLTMEAIESGKIHLDDKVSVSENASKMGGTQIYLAPGEIRTVEELIKGIAIESGNDCAVAIGEYISGTEEEFVKKMNERASELGMNNTHFVNSSGLPVANHYTSATDIAIMSKELIKHEKILVYTSTYTETITEGRKQPFTMWNTNKLIKFYKGCDGLKTGTSSEAKSCISATAKRDNMRLIAIILGAPNVAIRNREASKLFDYGFARNEIVKLSDKNEVVGNVKVLKGKETSVNAIPKDEFLILIEKGNKKGIQKDINITKQINAGFKKGEKLGDIIASIDGKEIGRMDIVAEKSVDKAGVFHMIKRTYKSWIGFGNNVDE